MFFPLFYGAQLGNIVGTMNRNHVNIFCQQAHTWTVLPLLLFGGSALLSSLLVLLLPETSNTTLPDTVRQAEALNQRTTVNANWCGHLDTRRQSYQDYIAYIMHKANQSTRLVYDALFICVNNTRGGYSLKNRVFGHRVREFAAVRTPAEHKLIDNGACFHFHRLHALKHSHACWCPINFGADNI